MMTKNSFLAKRKATLLKTKQSYCKIIKNIGYVQVYVHTLTCASFNIQEFFKLYFLFVSK